MNLARGIAQVSFQGGGLFLPARSPYDRELLIEHVSEYLRSKPLVQVLIDNQRWMIRRKRALPRSACNACGYATEFACSSRSRGDGRYCLSCAFGLAGVAQLPYVQRRQAS